jgi:hypothetical protein
VDKLKKTNVDIYFYYISPATRLENVNQSGTGQRLTLAELKLNGAAEPPNRNSEESKDQSAFNHDAGTSLKSKFQLAWENGGDDQKRLLTEIEKTFGKPDGSGGEFAEQRKSMNGFIFGSDVDPNPEDLARPIALRKSLETCNVLLHLLSDDVYQRAEKPLNDAALVVIDRISPNRVVLSAINDVVADHNTRFKNLQTHVEKLKLIDQVLSGTRLNLETASLDLLDRVTAAPEEMKPMVVKWILNSLVIAKDKDESLVQETLRVFTLEYERWPYNNPPEESK